MSSDPKREPEKRSSRDNHALWFTRDTLSQAFTLGGCAVCSAVHVAERKAIHSFLHEGMMFKVSMLCCLRSMRRLIGGLGLGLRLELSLTYCDSCSA
jgi:hypothetical protein